jgi:hypothetical protein
MRGVKSESTSATKPMIKKIGVRFSFGRTIGVDLENVGGATGAPQ